MTKKNIKTKNDPDKIMVICEVCKKLITATMAGKNIDLADEYGLDRIGYCDECFEKEKLKLKN